MWRDMSRVMVCVVALMIVACSGDSQTPPQPYYLNLYGTVTAEPGVPVSGARVRVWHAPRECTLAGITARIETLTAPNGTYRMELLIGTSTGGCFTVAFDP